MRNLFLAAILLFTQIAIGVETGTANQVLRYPSSAPAGTRPTYGAVNLASASAVTGTLALTNGGTGQATAAAAFNALSPMTTTGDLEYESGAATASRLAGNTTTVPQGLVSTGTGSVAQAPAWQTTLGSSQIWNNSLSASVGSNALTISLVGQNGSAPSSSNQVIIPFRSATQATGTWTPVSVTGSLSVVIPSGTTIGTSSGVGAYIYLYAMNNAGTAVLAVSLSGAFDEAQLQSSTAISGGSSSTTLYSTASQTSLPIRLLGRVYISEATAGTWASSPTELDNVPLQQNKRQVVIGTVQNTSSTTTSASYGNLTNAVSVTFTAARTGLYRVSSVQTLSQNSTVATNNVTVANTSGSGTFIAGSDVLVEVGSTSTFLSTYCFGIWQLQQGTSYTFNLQAKTSGGTLTIQPAIGSGGNGLVLVAEEL